MLVLLQLSYKDIVVDLYIFLKLYMLYLLCDRQHLTIPPFPLSEILGQKLSLFRLINTQSTRRKAVELDRVHDPEYSPIKKVKLQHNVYTLTENIYNTPSQ